ncbi:DNA pilot protein [Microviridae sp.]|jgi:hypothetical protein|nr:DNA pilot protein [Microviridae sp.]
MPAPLAVPLITAGAGLLGNIFGTLGGNASRKKEANRARAHDINMWDRTNAYNHPSQQIERLKAAGLNPNLVYGGSSGQTAGTANSLPGAKAADIRDIQPGNEIMQYVNLKNTEAQTDNLKTQNGVLTADKILKTAQADTELSKQTDLSASAEYKKAQIQKTLKDILKTASETEKLDAETGNIRKEGKYKDFELERASRGQLRGDDYKKVILDTLLSIFHRQNPQQFLK